MYLLNTRHKCTFLKYLLKQEHEKNVINAYYFFKKKKQRLDYEVKGWSVNVEFCFVCFIN